MMGFDRHELVGRHFSGESSAFGDRRLFRHLRRCEGCRHQYRTYAALESLDRDGDTRARERMARAIFPPASPRRVLFGAGIGALALASVAIVMSVDRSHDSFQARGSGQQPAARSTPSLEIFRMGAGGRSERVGSTIRPDEALAFSFVNPRAGDTAGGAAYLMVFARDAGGHVFWFWPAWDNPADDPGSLPIARTDQPLELGESVRHQLQPGPLTVFGLFSERPYRVKQIEAALSQQGPGGLGALGGFVWTETVEVLR